MTAEYIPIGNATIQVKSNVDKVSTMVSGNLSLSIAVTGRFHWNEYPKSPCRTMFEIHFQYCTRNGSSSPYLDRNASRAAASTVSPSSSNCATSVVTKSPGGNWMIANETNEIASMVGTMYASRRRM